MGTVPTTNDAIPIFSQKFKPLFNLSDVELKKRLAFQINLDDWTDDWKKCGYRRLLHKELHRASLCTQEREVPNILDKNGQNIEKESNLF